MKNFYTLLIVFLFFGMANAQIVTIPDANFKAKLLEASPNNTIAKKTINGLIQNIKIDSNTDGELQQSELDLVEYLDVSNSQISSLVGINSFTYLTNLKCQNNSISSLIVTNTIGIGPNSNARAYMSINCSHNNMITFEFPDNNILEDIDCSYNNLTSINFNQLGDVYNFNCSHNLLTTINLTNSSTYIYYTFDCSYNQLMSFYRGNSVFNGTLDCSYNQISDIGAIFYSDSIITNFSHNLLVNVNVKSSLGLFLFFNDNLITALNFEGDCNILEIGNNFLQSLDLSKPYTTIDRLYMSNNPITSLNLKNNYSQIPYIEGGEILQYICADEFEVESMQQYISANYPNCQVNSYCSFTPGGTFYTITGTNTYDENNNGCDALDTKFPNLKYAITNGTVTGSIMPNQSGDYAIPVQAGTHTITPVIENPAYFTISPASTTVTFPATVSPTSRDFCLTTNGLHNDLEVTTIPLNTPIPGFDVYYKIIYKNKGTQTQSGTLNLTFNDSVLDLVTVSAATTSQTLNNINWSFTNLLPFETREIWVTLNLNSPTETPPVNAGFLLNYTTTITAATDETPLDNIAALNQIVVNSYDPNDKTCLEGATITPSQVGKEVHYMIRFENNGTANAHNIVVKDMIDTTKFDVNSLIPIKGSHSFVTRITDTNKVEFIFENINLPFDDANNDGYIAFKIKTKPSLVLGNTFSNTASIYFDYNFPIITNPAVTTVATVLENQDFEFASYFAISPNPAKEVLTISSKQESAISSISIYNVLGQLVQIIPNAKNMKSIDVSDLKTGNYFIKVISDKGSSSSKFMKE